MAEQLNAIPPDEYDDWMMFGHVLKTIADWVGGDEEAFRIWDNWCRKWHKYEERAAATQREKWDRAFGTPTEHPIGLLRKHAQANGWTPSEAFQKEGRKWRSEAARRMLDELPDSASADDIEPVLRIVSGLPELQRDEFVDQIAKRFKWRLVSVRNTVGRFLKEATTTDEETDYGVVVARRVLSNHFAGGRHLIRASDRFFWQYNGKHWQPIENDDEVIGQKCLDIIRELGKIRQAVETVAQQAVSLLKKLQAKEGDPLRLLEPLQPVINCQNGELWLNDDGSVTLKRHNPESYLRFCLSISYDPEATCPMFDQTVLEVFQDSPEPEELRRHFYEFCGYAIQPSRDIKQFWMLEGTGDNGKTGLINTLEKTIGDDAVYSIDLSKVKEDYHMSQLKQKLLLRDNDVDYRTVLPDGMLKQLSEDARLTGRDPYGRPKQFTNCTLPVLLCNKYPLTKDLSHGVLVRAQVIPFRHKFVDGIDMKRGLFKDIWKTELPGVLNRAIEGLRRLRARGRYLEPKDCLIAKQEFLRQANPLPRFLASDACVTSLEALRHHIENQTDFSVALSAAQNKPEQLAQIKNEVAAKVAEAERAGLRQTMADFYKYFWQWCRNEGIGYEKPRKADVENYLTNLGYGMMAIHNQKWVEGVMAFDQGDHRPSDGF